MKNSVDTPAELRAMARRARHHATGIWPHPSAQSLVAWADQLDRQAHELEKDMEREGGAGTHQAKRTCEQ